MIDIHNPEALEKSNLKLENVKYAVFTESSYDPPAGGTTIYMDAWGENYDDLLWPIDEIADHFKEMLDESDEDDEDARAFFKMVKSKKPTRKYLEGFSFDNGGLGCECVFVARGKEIAPKTLEFFSDTFDVDEVIDENEEAEAILERAEQNPEDLSAVIDLIRLVSDTIESHNESQY